MRAARCYAFGPFWVDTSRRLLLRHQRPVNLTAKVFDLLTFLLRERDRAISRVELFQALWPDVVVEDGNLSVSISVLRKALQDGAGSRYIETLPRVGYRFCGDVIEHSGQGDGREAEFALARRAASARAGRCELAATSAGESGLRQWSACISSPS